MGGDESKERKNDCKADLADLKTRFDETEKDISDKTEYYMTEIEKLRDEFLAEEKDGGKLLLNVQEMGDTIQQEEINIEQKEQEEKDLEIEIKKMEQEISELEYEIKTQEGNLKECQSQEGLLLPAEDYLAGIVIAGATVGIAYKMTKSN